MQKPAPRSIVTLTVLILSSFSFIRCNTATQAPPVSIGAGGTGPASPYKACSGDSDCQSAPTPVCANLLNVFCETSTHQCAYQLKKASGCQCVAGVIRECPTGAGIQTCVATSSTQASWGGCGPCPDAG